MTRTLSDGVVSARRRRLRALIEQWGGVTPLAKKLGHSGPSYLSQLAGGVSPFTEKAARKIEAGVGLPQGWLDDPKPEKSANVNLELVSAVIAAVGTAAENDKINLRPAKFSEAVILVYEEATRTGRIDEGYVSRILKLAR